MLCLFVLVLRLVCYVISLNARARCVNQSGRTSSFFFYQMKTKKSREKSSRLFPALFADWHCRDVCVDVVARCNCFGVGLVKRIRKHQL